MSEGRNRARLAAIKVSSGCVDCGYRDHPAALQFDHVRGVKLGNVSEMIRRPWSVILAEVEKCQVVCANHHALRGWRRLMARAA